MDLGLTNKKVLITGASQGIGEGAARVFAAEGAALKLTARRGDVLDSLAASLRAGVLRSASSVPKLCAGSPSSVFLLLALTLARSETSAFATGVARFARAPSGSSSSNSIGASFRRMCHSTWQASMHRNTCARTRFSE
ncbi:MAG: SDR family NAD(P)-dependent oxidoreductase [Albidovulum sp.]|nr:SDR family NAD(P)-dependent oxidoreductase [Albidovulum sp.]